MNGTYVEIIGLSGYARSGKDEAAKVLVEAHGFKRVAFADKLRDVLYALNPLVSGWRQWDSEPGAVYVQDVIDRYTWDTYKETIYSDEIRRLLQRLGTEAGRQTLWDSIWVDAALTGHPEDARLVVTDCRFPNEAQAIKDLGGQVWRVKRPGVVAVNGHSSETALDDWRFDFTLFNATSLLDLRAEVNKHYILRRK